MPGNAKRHIRFGEFEVDFAAGEVRKNRRPVRLQDQPFRILQCLLERPGEIVTREELRKEIWGEDVYVDFDRSLNTSVARLREALSDSPTRPAFIETVPRKGYRFIASVESGDGEQESVPAAVPPDPNRRSLRPYIFAAVVCLGLGLGAWWLVPSEQPIPEVPLAAKRLTYFDGIEAEPDFSPDGNQVVFTWNGKGQDNFDVYVTAIGGTSPVRLTTDPQRDFSPAWSPDGRWIAFLREIGDGRAALYRIPALGGGETRLHDIESPRRGIVGGRAAFANYLCWTPDSQRLIIPDRGAGGGGLSLFLFDPSTGAKLQVTAVNEVDAVDISPDFSPGGETLAFVRSYLRFANSEIRTISWPRENKFDSPGGSRILDSPLKRIHACRWGRSPSELIVGTSSSLGLWKTDLYRPNEPVLLQVGASDPAGPAVSREAQRMVFSHPTTSITTWRLELDRRSPKGAPAKLLSSAGYSGNGQYSPDGTKIALTSDRLPGARLWISDADGNGAAPLLHDDRQHGTPRWSPDGRRIAFDMQSERGDSDIWTVSAEGGPPEQLTDGPADDRVPRWSRDGEWLYFASNRGDGYQIWKRSTKTGEESQVTRNGGFYAIEGPHSRFVYFSKMDASLWKVPVGGGAEERVLESLSNSWASHAVGQEGIYFSPSRKQGEASVIQFYSFANGSIVDVFRTEDRIPGVMDVSPDGKYVLYTQDDIRGSDLMLVENFR